MEKAFTEQDAADSKQLHADLMAGKITDQEVYELVKLKKLSPGLEFLIGDYIDLGRWKAEEMLAERKQEITSMLNSRG